MTAQEANKLLAAMYRHYPDSRSEHMADTVLLWQAVMANEDYSEMGEALEAFVRGNAGGCPPSAGQLGDKAKELKANRRKKR